MNLTSSSRPKSREGGPCRSRRPGLLSGRACQVLQRESALGHLFVLPAVLLLVGLVAYPFIIALWLSLTDAYVGRAGHFIGLQNFLTLFMEDDIFRQTLQQLDRLYQPARRGHQDRARARLRFCWRRTCRLKRLIRGAVLLPWVIRPRLRSSWLWMFDSLYSVINWTPAPPGGN